MICTYCTTVITEWFIPQVYDQAENIKAVPIHAWTYSSWEELNTSAKSCNLCALIIRESHTSPKGPFNKSTRTTGIRFEAWRCDLEIWDLETNRKTTLRVGIDLKEVNLASERAQKRFDSRTVSLKLNDERSIRTIKHWIQTCSSHALCNVVQAKNLPTRVLDVGSNESPLLKLHKGGDEAAGYCCLSYCWGRGNIYTTTTSNIEAHLNMIDIKELPNMLQDAVILTRLIGIRYLWIDALCIIQDDKEDWAREASVMHRIYNHAKLTIATDIAPDSSYSLFEPRSDRHGQVVTVPWPFPDANGPLNLHISPRFQNFSAEIANSHLSKRGWCFQERALSTRTLHIGQDMCFWECKEACIGEDDEMGKYSVQDNFFHLRDIMLSNRGEREATVVKWCDKWSWVIQEFSRRLLTHDTDRFAAFEGVVNLFDADNILGKYICGLWENELLRHLLWASDGPGPHKRPSQYRAPSWSWLSIEGPVKNPFIEIAHVFTREGLQLLDELGNDGRNGSTNRLTLQMMNVLNVNVQTQGPSEFSPAKYASLQAVGILERVKRGMHINGLDLLQTLNGETVGLATWDIASEKSESEELWIAPVMMKKLVADGKTCCEGLVLRSADESHGESKQYARVARGMVINFFFARDIEMRTFTIL